MIESEIEKHFKNSIEINQQHIVDEIGKIFGEDIKKIAAERIKNLFVVFEVSKSDVERNLDFDCSEEDRKLLEYFLQQFESNTNKKINNGEKLYIGKYDKPTAYNVEEFIKSDSTNTIVYTSDGEFISYYKQLLFDTINENKDDLIDDLYDFWHVLSLLDFTFADRTKKAIFYPYSYVKLESDNEKLFEDFYYRIMYDLTWVITNNLHSRNIYLMDTKYTSEKFPYDILSHIPRKFYESFGDIISLIFVNPNMFIDIVGRENFTKFAESFLENPLDESLDDLIEEMLLERERKIKYEIVGINIPLIMKTWNETQQKKQETPKSSAVMLSIRSKRRQTDSEWIKNNLIKIENMKINNLKIIDNKIIKFSAIDDELIKRYPYEESDTHKFKR